MMFELAVCARRTEGSIVHSINIRRLERELISRFEVVTESPNTFLNAVAAAVGKQCHLKAMDSRHDGADIIKFGTALGDSCEEKQQQRLETHGN